MESTFTIQEASQLTGVNPHTLRYYELINLLDSIQRDPSGYRQYSAYDLACVDFLTKLRATQMPIRKMKQFAELRRQGLSTAHQRRVLLEEHYEAVMTSQQALNHSLEVIRRKIAYYQELEIKALPKELVVSSEFQASRKHDSISIPLEPAAAAQELFNHLDLEHLSVLIELLQRKTNTGVNP